MKEIINTSMIILAREARSMNQNQLAEKIKMSATNLSKIERGDIGINNEAVECIADITGFPTHFFQQPGEVVPEYLGYRKRQKVPQKILMPVHAIANIIRLNVQFLTRQLGVRMPSLPCKPVEGSSSPATIAAWLRKKWEIQKGPIQDLVKIFEERGIAISCFDFGTDRVDSKGLFTEDGQAVIFLNKRLLGDKQRFSLAYELGQLVMHRFHDLPLHRDLGHEANQFAAEFLMPARDISTAFRKGVSLALLGELKKTWKVSMIALLYRADDLGFITPNQKRYLLQQFNSMQIRRREPVELDISPEEPSLIKNWIGDYKKRTGLGPAEMSALFCLNTDEFLELYS